MKEMRTVAVGITEDFMRTAQEELEKTKAYTTMFPNYIVHENEWWWGKTLTLVHKEGLATVELQIDENYPSVAFIKGLSVFGLNRHQGLGKEMMAICEQLAEKEGKRFMQLSVTRMASWLPGWYKRLGYTIIQKDEHEYTMWKEI